MKGCGYWRVKRPLLLVEGMLDLSRREIFGLRLLPLKREVPFFKAEQFTRKSFAQVNGDKREVYTLSKLFMFAALGGRCGWPIHVDAAITYVLMLMHGPMICR